MPNAGILSPNIKNRNHSSPDTSVTLCANNGRAEEHSDTFAQAFDPVVRFRLVHDHVRAPCIVV
jgi:hypothetical protein